MNLERRREPYASKNHTPYFFFYSPFSPSSSSSEHKLVSNLHPHHPRIHYTYTYTGGYWDLLGLVAEIQLPESYIRFEKEKKRERGWLGVVLGFRLMRIRGRRFRPSRRSLLGTTARMRFTQCSLNAVWIPMRLLNAFFFRVYIYIYINLV